MARAKPASRDLSTLAPEEALQVLRKPHKYAARRTVFQGETYDSAAEARYAEQLEWQFLALLIAGWRRGREWVLLDAPKRRDRIAYRPDFEVWRKPDASDLWCVDVKGVLTPVFRLKAKLFRARYPDVVLKVVDAQGSEVRV